MLTGPRLFVNFIIVVCCCGVRLSLPAACVVSSGHPECKRRESESKGSVFKKNPDAYCNERDTTD